MLSRFDAGTADVRYEWEADVGRLWIRPYQETMLLADNQPPRSLGLGGDEIAAIAEVEQRFGVRLDYSNARNWTTAGDVFAALNQALPVERAEAPGTWAQFADAICMETGVDPARVTSETLLLGQGRFDRRVLLIVAALIGLAVAVFQHC